MSNPQTFVYTGGTQTFTVPTGITSLNVTVSGAQGAQGANNGGSGGAAAVFDGVLTVTPGEVLTITVGGQSGYPDGGVIFALGDPGNGGGSSRISNSGGTNLIIAAGGGGGAQGATYGGGSGGAGGLTGSAGTSDSYSNPGQGGSLTAGGAGGAAAPPNGAAGTAGASLAGGVGGPSSGSTPFGGSGGGGLFGGGGGSGTTYSGDGAAGGGGGSSLVPSGFISGQDAQSANGSVVISYAAAPSAPTLTSPANASYLDASVPITLSGVYNSTDGDTQNAYALRIKTSGASSYSYFNASTNALQSTIVWNADSVSSGASWSVTLPSGLLANGNIYNWSMASQESGMNLQGAFAADFTFTGQSPPSLVVTVPSGTVTGTTEPGVSWTNTLASGAVQTNYQIIVESGSYATVPGSGTQVWTSGVVSSSSTSVPVGTPLSSNVTYRVFVQVTETGAETSAWAYSTFTLQVDVPATPVFTATPGNDPVTGAPMVTLNVQAIDNQLTANQASLETGATTGWNAGTNTTIAASSTWAQDGTYSMAMTATAAGAVSATTPSATSAIPVSPGQTVRALASFNSSATARPCTVAISFFSSSGAFLSTTTSTAVNSTLSGNGGQPVITAVVPALSAFMSITVSGSGLSAGEILNVDEILLAPGTSTTWTAGGFVGTTMVNLMFSDDGVNWFPVRNGTGVAIPSGTQLVSVIDYEGSLGFTRNYQAQVVT